MMATRWAELWRWQGTIERKTFALTGLGALVLKFLLDRSVAVFLFHREWFPWSYWMPLGAQPRAGAMTGDARWFAAVMLLMAVPFLWLGVTLTVQRLRDAGQPVWLVVVFFVPVINLLFFAMLCVMPPKPREVTKQAMPWPETRSLDRWIPRSEWGAALLAIGITAVIGLFCTLLGTAVLKDYGLGLFVALPFCLGLFAALLFCYHGPHSYRKCLGISLLPLVILGGTLLLVAAEGVICILMASPFAIVLAALGGSLGYAIQAGYWHGREAPAMLSIVLLFMPAFASVEHFVKPQAETFEVKTVIEVNAPPERVWKQLVAFAEIAPPQEVIFHAGIAYPIRAEITGTGPGAVRHCVFSTGAFVEPIEIWDEPRLLKFSVTDNPPPMEELTPYKHIEPQHLHGYFVSHEGQFLLTALPSGKTRLEGTTWYSHTIWPAAYWHLWSDYIVHRIHFRVLEHIRARAEGVTG